MHAFDRLNLLFCLEAKFCQSACETFHLSFAKYDSRLRGFVLPADKGQVVLLLSHAVSTLSLHRLARNPTSWTQNPVTEWTTLVPGPHTLVSEATQKNVIRVTNFSTNIIARTNFAEIIVRNLCLAFFLTMFSQSDCLKMLLLTVVAPTILTANVVYFRFDSCFRCFVRSCLRRSV
jgi:hypothetical protein